MNNSFFGGIRQKLVGFFVLLFVALSVATYVLFQRYLSRDFQLLEIQRGQKNATRIENLVEYMADRLRRTVAVDWGQYDKAYEFVTGKSTEFVDRDLSWESAEITGFAHYIVTDRGGKVLVSGEFSHSAQAVLPLSDVAHHAILSQSRIKSFMEKPMPEGVAGLARIGELPFFVSIAQIIPTNGEGEAGGFLIFTKPADAATLSELSALSQLAISFSTPDSPIPSLAPNQNEHRFAIADDFISGIVNIPDMNGAPLIKASFRYPHDILSQGYKTKTTMLLALVGFLILGSVLLWLVVDYILLRPLNIMAKRLSSVSPDQLSAHMLDDSRSDELGVLARVFNALMASLSASYIDLKHAKDAAEQANKAKSSFIAKVSHELRTPIHSITGMLRILLREERASGKRNYIMMARNAAYGLLETINEILDFSKAEAGKLILERVEFSLHDAVREAIQTVGPRIEEKGSLETIVEIPQGIPDKVLGDPLRLRQVLVNLLGNATKFTKQGHIGLQVTMHACNAQQVLIEMTVFDTGVGIPADRLDHIFEPFGQADESVSRLFTGTGLGLTIVKQFIEGMGGTVRVESQLGVGSRFILNIPFERAAESTPVVYKPALSSARVALLDGDSAVIERFSHDLEESGYIPEIVRCDNPLELAALAKSINQYGLIIVTSEAMKHSQVFDLVVDLRGREAVPVVSVLSPFEISVRERLLALEVPFVVTRPTSLLDILGVVSGAVSLSSEAWEDAEDWSLQLSRPLEVLVADDAQTNRIILTELLRDAGHNVVCVENGLEMVTLVKDSLEGVPGTPVFDIVLTDVQMPLLDGLSATSQIRALERELGTKRPLPIVAVTAHAMTDETSRMRNFGVDDVVTKPLDPLRLGQVIQRLTGQQSSTPMQSQSGQSTPTTPDKNLTDTQLAELGLRMWTKLATRDDSVSELFGLSEEPSSPEDFQRVLDLGDVLERSGNSVRRTLLILRGFLDCYREQLQKLNDAKQSKNAEELRFASHALKGLLLDIGARASGGLASSIEQLSKDGQGEEGCNLVGSLTKQALLVARLVAQIEQVASGRKAPTEGDNINQQETNESIEPE